MKPPANPPIGWTVLEPTYSVHEGRELIGVLHHRGHLFLASFVFPLFVQGDALAIALFFRSARTRAAEAIASMMREVFPAEPAGMN